MVRKLMALTALAILTACDSSQRADRQHERTDRHYRAAMNDYQSGRLDAAIKGFEKVVRNDPANASARFQLGCLLQDQKHDFAGAYGCYREFLQQDAESDKAALTRERLAVCEREFATILATKYGLTGDAAAAAAELEATRKSLKAAETRVAEVEKNLGEALARVRALSAERDRLLDVVKGVGPAESAETAETGKDAVVREARELLEESDEDSATLPAVAREAAALKAEEEPSSSSELLPQQTVRQPAAKERKADAKPVVPVRPKTYVVAEGDTLYGVAKRFYGTVSAWKGIKAANKALISADNRLRVGDTITLP